MNVPARGGGFRAQADAVGNEADNDEIRRQLVRIVGSAPLIGSLRLTRFLTFVVKATLAGEGARIKAYTIAVKALGRGSDFDPQADPIVRVEAGRLRTALARYYADAGRDDPVTIELPRGSYVPTFRRPEPNKPQVPAPTKIDQSPTVDHASRWSVLVERRRESERLRGAVERQFVELHAEMRATRVALKDSQALLGQQSDRGVARPAPAPTLPPLSQAAETPADPVNVEQVAAPALPRLPEPSPRLRSRAASAPSKTRRRTASAATRELSDTRFTPPTPFAFWRSSKSSSTSTTPCTADPITACSSSGPRLRIQRPGNGRTAKLRRSFTSNRRRCLARRPRPRSPPR